jgi:hypothetical protein
MPCGPYRPILRLDSGTASYLKLSQMSRKRLSNPTLFIRQHQ